MYDYQEQNSGGGFSTLLFLAIIIGVGYFLVKKVLPWINLKLGKDFKWYHIPLAIVAIGGALLAWSTVTNSQTSKKVNERHNRLNSLTDAELMRIIDSGSDMDDRRAARIIMETRLERRKRMINK